MSEKHNILIYYYRNVKKLSILRILKFILDVQQRFIGAIFVLIVLRKTTLAVVLVYWLYIGYFYYSDHNAKQLKITNMFIAVITLLQYTIILLQQNIPSKDVNNLDENVILIDYLWLLLFPNLVKAQYLSNRFNAIFKIVGIVGLDQKTLLYDSIPTILFQITIFYYDFFLLFCAERLETVYLRIRREIFFIQSDPMGKILYMINYKNWKDPMTKLLLSVTSIAIVRLIEIVVIVLLVLNIFYASPIWNFFRLGLLFFMYSNIAFRPLSEADLVRTRLQRILFLAVVYLWVRVVITSCIDVYISLLPAGTIPPQLIQLLRIEMGEKFILVVEFFLLEYTSSVYFSQEFKNVAAKIIKKKVIRSQIIATCMSYELNEDKLMKYIEGFSQRIKLENDIMTLNKAIGDWKIGRTSQAIKSMAGVGTDDAEGETYELSKHWAYTRKQREPSETIPDLHLQVEDGLWHLPVLNEPEKQLFLAQHIEAVRLHASSQPRDREQQGDRHPRVPRRQLRYHGQQPQAHPEGLPDVHRRRYQAGVQQRRARRRP